MNHKRLLAIDAYFRATNYLSVGQIYLKENGLLHEPLKKAHIKPRLIGHFGTTPGLNFIYAHLNRLIQDTKSQVLLITGPGHGAPAIIANTFLEGSLSEIYPEYTHDVKGVTRLCKHFSWPEGFASHTDARLPGSIHEGGELGYSLVHAFGAAFDNKDLIVACVIGDGEAETGPLFASLQSCKFLNLNRDGVVLPILHLNGYKIAQPTLFGRMKDKELYQLFKSLGYDPIFCEGSDPMKMHRAFSKVLDLAYKKIEACKKKKHPKLPFIILRTPKGWTCPQIVDGKQVEGTFRAHQVPVADVIENEEHFVLLENWLKSYRPWELFDDEGKPNSLILSVLPEKKLQMGRSPFANGGKLLKELELPDFRNYEIIVKKPGESFSEATKVAGYFLRDLMRLNPNNFRIVCPDELASNRLSAVFETTRRMYLGKIVPSDENLSDTGRVLEVLSEHLCQGWLEGYLLTGRHGLFPCYEAFALIIDSMLNQYGKWLKKQSEHPWRAPIASLNYLLTSHAWRQDHNGYSHQGPGFIESVMQKKEHIARIYLPIDANTLVCTLHHCLKSKNYINLIVIGKQPLHNWLTMKEAEEHCKKGISKWEFASNDANDPDIIMASSGDVPTLETLGAITLLRKAFPEIKIRMVNVFDLFTLPPSDTHSHGISDEEFSKLFGKEIPVIFAFHGYPRVIHELIYRRSNASHFHVRGYIEEGSTTTPFDMAVANRISRYHLAELAIKRSKTFRDKDISMWKEALQRHRKYIIQQGDDLKEVKEWKWDL